MTFIPPSLRDAWGQVSIWTAPPTSSLLAQDSSSIQEKAILAGELPALLEEAQSVAIIRRFSDLPDPVITGIEHAIEVDGYVSVAYTTRGESGTFDEGEAIEVRIRWGEMRRTA